ncbi:MAG: ABC transporter permease, partial [Anaerolineae bacterium]
MSDQAIAPPGMAEPELLARRGAATLWRRLHLNSLLIGGACLLLVVIAAALAAPLLTPYDPIAQDLNHAFLPPLSPGHPLGTDNFGRDIWSRIIYAARLDLQIAFLAVLFPFFFGSLLGVVTGYFGGKIDLIVMRLVDVLMSFPFLILVIAIMSLLGTGLRNFYIAIGIVGWIPYARLVR